MTTLTGEQVADAGLDGRDYLPTLDGGLQTRIRTGNFAAGLALVVAIGAAAEAMDHHPELDLRYHRPLDLGSLAPEVRAAR